MIRISVVVPVRNEAGSIRELLDSLLSQTRRPDEIVITDGGSADGTPEIIEGYIKQGFPVRLIREKAAFPGRGRNLAAAQANFEWLAFTDAGISPAADWLEALARRAETESADVVYGAWEPVVDSLFKKCAAIAYLPPPTKSGDSLIRPRFIASALMRRAVWESVGGFPEHLRSAEDLLFMNSIERANFRVASAPHALVKWQLQPTIGRTFRRFVSYARNNMRAGLWRQWQAQVFKWYGFLLVSALPVFVMGSRWLLITLLLWLSLLAARSVVAIRRNRTCYPAGIFQNLVRLIVIVPLLATLDAATFIGTLQWVLIEKLHASNSNETVRNGT
ncbi:MAG: glycosyltransferase [Pyrinomonadaceae bacterium]|nr:glycosyltransferase [Pyrinomonadaceae bacterium]